MDQNYNPYNTGQNNQDNHPYYNGGPNQNNGPYTNGPYNQNGNPYGAGQYDPNHGYTQNNGGYQPYNNGGGYQPYGTGYSGPVGDDGKPLKNRFGMKLTFSILEILSCNLVTFILGIVACVNTAKANTSYKEGRWQDFKSQAKVSAVCLWVGLAAFILGIFIIAFSADAIIGDVRTVFYGTEAEPTSTDQPEIALYVDGVFVMLPSTYESIESIGLSLDRYDISETLGVNEVELYALINPYGEYVAWAWFENQTGHETGVTDCTVIGINVDADCANTSYFMTMEGLTFYSSEADCIDALGSPDERDDDSHGREVLYWYLDDGSDELWRVIEITFDTYGNIYQFDIDYR